MSFGEVLEGLRSGCPGARAAAIVDHDGIPVASSPADPALETLCAEFAAILHEVRQAGREFHHGVLKQFSVFGEDVIIILTSLGPSYFLLVVLERDGLAGKARFLSRLVSTRLYAEFV